MGWTDLHIHSDFSDGRLSIPQIVDLYGQRGFSCIAITDHLCEEKSFLGKAAIYTNRSLTRARFDQYLETIHAESERALKQYQMLVIPGFEITKNTLHWHRSAHLLALGVERWISADEPIISILNQIKAAGGLSIAAHPVSANDRNPEKHLLWSLRDELGDLIDAWEITDTGRILEKVIQSRVRKLATSDLHREQQIRSWKTIIDCERHPQAIFQAIRRQNVDFKFFSEAA
jgi:PHP family Zn ribbon phosphoesterase